MTASSCQHSCHCIDQHQCRWLRIPRYRLVQPPSQQHGLSSDSIASVPGSPDNSNARQQVSAVTAGGRLQAATDMAVLSHHAAAINASLVAAGSRLAGASSRAPPSAPAQHEPAAWRPLSVGGTSVTESMHSATSGRSDRGGARGPSNLCTRLPGGNRSTRMQNRAQLALRPQISRCSMQACQHEHQCLNGAAKVSQMLDSTRHAMNRYAGR